MKKFIKNSNWIKIFFLQFFIPSFVFAFNDLQSFIPAFSGLITSLIPIAFGAGLLVFFWGLAKFIYSAGDERKVEEGRHIMVWGLIALFVMASVWGIIKFIQTDLGLQGINTIQTIPN